jgi:polyisoprenoid-binding protein YceI
MTRRPLPRAIAAALVAGLALPAAAAPEEFVVEPGHTFPRFSVDHLGISTQRGRFDRTRGRIVIDREAGTGSVEIAIDAGSASTGNAALDAVVRGEDILDAQRHPLVTFRSHAVSFEGDVPSRASGELTLAGVTRPVELRIVRFGCTRRPFLVRVTCGADATATLRRSDFGITAFAGLVGEEVAVEIQVEAVRQEPDAGPQPSGG